MLTTTQSLKDNSKNTIIINNKQLSIEFAITPEQHKKGLMFRESLCENCGMLFVFESSDIYSFWMKNTLISLDMIWIDSTGKIVDIAKNTKIDTCKNNECKPVTYTPLNSAKYVLEVNAGFTKQNNIKVGDFVEGYLFNR